MTSYPIGISSLPYTVFKYLYLYCAGKDDIFGGDLKDLETSGKSLYFVRALSYCDINKIELSVLKETLNTYPEFAEEFMSKIQVTFNLKRVSKPSTSHISDADTCT